MLQTVGPLHPARKCSESPHPSPGADRGLMDDPHPLAILAAAAVLWVLEASAKVALFSWMLIEATRDYLGGS